jgi:hypothetical protein
MFVIWDEEIVVEYIYEQSKERKKAGKVWDRRWPRGAVPADPLQINFPFRLRH